MAKCLHQLEMNNDKLKQHLSQIFINSAEILEYEQSNGSPDKCLFVKIPHRSLNAYHKVSEEVIKHLGKTYNWPVLVSATRTILSKRGKTLVYVTLYIAKRHRTQKIPRSWCLKSVHEEILQDLVNFIIKETYYLI